MVAVVEVIVGTKHFGVDTLLHRQNHPVLHGSQPEYRSGKINGLGLLTLPYKLTNSGWAGDPNKDDNCTVSGLAVHPAPPVTK